MTHFTTIPTDLLMDERLTALDVRLYAAMVAHTNTDGLFRRPMSAFEKKLGSRPTLLAARRRLQAAGYITYEGSTTPPGRVNAWRIHETPVADPQPAQ